MLSDGKVRAGARFRAARGSGSIVVAISIDFGEIVFSDLLDLKKNLKISFPIEKSVKNGGLVRCIS